MILPKAAEKEVFLRHKDKGGWEIGLELGYDKEYKIKEKAKLNIAMYNTYAKVKRHPERWDIPQEVADEVIKSVSARQHTGRYLKANRDAAIELKKTGSGINTSITSVRDKSWAVLDMKMSELMRSRKARDKVTINQLVSIAGTAFDKGQVLKGQSTENIAILAKVVIKDDTSPEDILKMAMNSRGSNMENNQ